MLGFLVKWAVIACIAFLVFAAVQSFLPDLIALQKTRPANPSVDWLLGFVLDWWFVFAIIVAILGILAFSKPSFGWVTTSFKAGGFWMALLTSFLVLTTFFFLLSKIYPNAPLFQPSEGYGHIALYFLLAGLMAMVAANLKGKAWFVNFALVILMFAMIGHRTADLLDPSGKLSAKIASILSFGGGGSRQVASVPSNPCNGVDYGPFTATTYGDAVVPNGARCKATLTVLYGKIRVDGVGGYVILDPTGIIENRITSPSWRAQRVVALSNAQYNKRLIPDS
jgi:hypothetical protein